MNTPSIRPRRLRTNSGIRQLVRETSFHPKELVQPIFIEEDIESPLEISSLPGLYRLPESRLTKEILELKSLGIQCVMPFGISHHKDDTGSDTWQPNGLLSRIIKRIKKSAPEMIVIPDICFCEYTTHGHCGIVRNDKVDNDATLSNLARQAVAAAQAGADMLAPSSSMDGQVKVIRDALDAHGFTHVAIMAHAAKFSSSYYGPFRSAVDCNIRDDRKAYQLDMANQRAALRDALLDEKEGADILIVKPGLPFLDILAQLHMHTNLPLAAYQVGGEYAAIKYAALAGALDEESAIRESIFAFKRAGADIIITYYAKKIAEVMQKNPYYGH
ncbi:porphobilinogen synthase [Halomonas sp. WWR20]